jgi:hypothetical protein
MAECVDVLSDLDLPRQSSVWIGQRSYVPGADHGGAVLLTAASWVLQRPTG